MESLSASTPIASPSLETKDAARSGGTDTVAPSRGIVVAPSGDGGVEEGEPCGGGVAADAGETTDGCGADSAVELVEARVAGERREEQRRRRPVPASRWSSSG